jgi:hypothetical protein
MPAWEDVSIDIKETTVYAHMSRHFNPVMPCGSPTRRKIRSKTKPSMIPKAVQVCHCITRAPRIFAGAHSAAYTGTVADCHGRERPADDSLNKPTFGPMPRPRTKRAAKRCGQLFVTPCQMQVRNESSAVMNMVPRRPRKRLRGSVSQHPRRTQQR